MPDRFFVLQILNSPAHPIEEPAHFRKAMQRTVNIPAPPFFFFRDKIIPLNLKPTQEYAATTYTT